MNRFPIPGVEVYKNPKNKFFVFQLHYSANPEKTDPSYRDAIKSAMPIQQYLQEFEIQWDSYAGMPVYPDFQRKFHGSTTSIDPVIGLPILRGWDFGLTPACVVAQYVDGQLRVIREFTAVNKGADQFSSEVLAQCRISYPQWSSNSKDWRDVIDPSGFGRKDTDMTTCAQVLGKKGIGCIPGPVTWESRRSAVEFFLCGLGKGGMKFQIALADCPTLVRGFEGGYRYDEKILDEEPNKLKPIKDEHSHPHDALQYICAMVRSWVKPRLARVPAPAYSWSQPASERIITKESQG